jgi:hypothetical protein
MHNIVNSCEAFWRRFDMQDPPGATLAVSAVFRSR